LLEIKSSAVSAQRRLIKLADGKGQLLLRQGFKRFIFNLRGFQQTAFQTNLMILSGPAAYNASALE